jgi:uncharacterized paraquat-inducible protein A
MNACRASIIALDNNPPEIFMNAVKAQESENALFNGIHSFGLEGSWFIVVVIICSLIYEYN